MPLPTWPSELPQKPYGGEPRIRRMPNIVATAMEVGPKKMWRRTTADSQLLTFWMLLTKPQVQALRAFYEDTVKGVLPFTWTDFIKDEPATYRFAEGEEPEYDFAGGARWRVTFRLEQLP